MVATNTPTTPSKNTRQAVKRYGKKIKTAVSLPPPPSPGKRKNPKPKLHKEKAHLQKRLGTTTSAGEICGGI